VAYQVDNTRETSSNSRMAPILRLHLSVWKCIIYQDFLLLGGRQDASVNEKSAYSMREDGRLKAIVLAGDKGKSHPVFGKNKAFLEVSGLPIIAYVISALQKSKSVSEIYVVGPKQRLEESLSSASEFVGNSKPIYVFEQGPTLYDNVWDTFLETLPSHYRSASPGESVSSPEADSTVLIVASDMPLLTAAEVDEFVSKCDMERYDCVLGFTREEDLKYYYPRNGQEGIRQAYLHFSEANLRQNNLFMVRPFKVGNRHYVQTMYDLRYQKEFANIIKLAWEILRREEGGWGALGYYFLLQLSLLFSRLRLGPLRDWVRSMTHAGSVAGCASELLKTRLGYVYTSLGGGALDVDKENEYEVIKLRFSEWMNYQQEKPKDVATVAPVRSDAQNL